MQDQGIGSWPRRRARRSPDRIAVVHDGTPLTYRALHERVGRLAGALHERWGVAPGDRVAHLGPNHPAFLENLFATAALGAVFVPLNTRLSEPELAHMLQDSGAGVLIAGPEHAATARALRPGALIVGDAYEAALAAAPDRPPAERTVRPEDPCVIMYTSGTTGTPKGAVLTHGNVHWNSFDVLIDLDLTADDITLVTAPLFHVAALTMTCLPTLLKGGRVVLASRFDPERVLDRIAHDRITFLFGVPTMYARIAASPRWADADLSALRILLCGGAPVPEALIRTYLDRGLSFVQGYGMTEATAGVLCLDTEQSREKAGSAGVPHFFTDVRVVGPDLSDVPPGTPGEVVVAGPTVFPGYWGRPDATADAFTDGWFRSGDVAVTDADGYTSLVDRVTDLFISGGENVYPAEVENVLHRHPAVAECAVLGVPDATWGEVGRALVVRHADSTADAAELLAFAAERLGRYKVPRTVEFVDALPRNAAGKVLKAQLRRTAPVAAQKEPRMEADATGCVPIAFDHRPPPTRVTFGPGALDTLPRLAADLGLRRLLVLSTPGRAGLAATAAELLGPHCAGRFPHARTHVPAEVAGQARAVARDLGADGCVAVGGGSTTGLAKALALDPGLPYVAVPTSYAGSEATSVWGLTDSGRKTTGRDPAVLPRAILYDTDLTLTLPARTSVTSGINAIAHAAEALYAPDTSPFVALLAEDGVRRLVGALPGIVRDPVDRAARGDALYGAWLCGSCLGLTTMSLHHKLCHVLGGALDLPHAETHTVVLPYVLAFNEEAAHDRLAPLRRALDTPYPPTAIQRLARSLGAPRSLADLGMRADDIDRTAELLLAQGPFTNPRPVGPADVRALLRAAHGGTDV
ncbi:long-chain-fatty-acid--CoA ligase [Streptomyces sp. NPDC048290]|uniref:long-chain-fatty-acid--CoA ligase n=1 Tax=Streptomyces sp. NPDC048290 TaxID=3155811 RepID=UPI0034185627